MASRTILAALIAALLAAAPVRAQETADPAPTDPAAAPATEQATGQAGEAGEAGAAGEAPPPAPPPVYEEQLLRLSEILGALHFLRGLCGDGDSDAWRNEMAALMSAEAPGPERLARLVARFNYGFESYNSVYRSCTPNARRAIAIYLAEGGRIAADLRTRYGQ